MSIKIRVGLSRKVGEPNFGSRGASIEVEAEVENSVVADNDRFQHSVRRLYEMARSAVDSELHLDPTVLSARRMLPSPGPVAEAGHNNPPLESSSSTKQLPPATASQIRAIYALCKRQQLVPTELCHQQFGKHSFDQLTVREASQLIDQLKNNLASA